HYPFALQGERFRCQPRVGALALPHRSLVVHDGRQLRPERCRGIYSHSRIALAVEGTRTRGGRAMKMWSGRFRQPLDPDFERWQRSFSFDRRLLKYELMASNSHARALKAAGILSSDELIGILHGLKQLGEKAAESARFLDDDEAEDVHHFVEKQLVALIGETGYKLHSGRSRNEQ